MKIIAPRKSYCSTHERPQQALQEQLIYVKNLRRRIREIIESENEKRRQAERESEAENLTELETDPAIRPEQETANGDRAVLETVPASQAEQGKDNSFLAEPEPDHQAGLQTVRQQLVSLIAAPADGS